MKIVDRYVLVSFLKNYLISFCVLVGIAVLLWFRWRNWLRG